MSTVSPNYGPVDISPDGSRFLVNTIKRESSSEPVTLVVNWPVELKK